MTPMSDREFGQFQRFIYAAAGISLSPAKKQLVCGRLGKRLRHYGLESYGQYFELLQRGTAANEIQVAIDLLTTNETFFFREPQHFDLLRRFAAETTDRSHCFRVWSAACSTGEEPYSIAMTLAEVLGDAPWEVLGSDISTRVLTEAHRGLYPQSSTSDIPLQYLRQYCLRGIGPQTGTMLINRVIRERVQFRQINLNAKLPGIGKFDVIFLRNAMIYFSTETKQEIVGRVISLLKPGGYFLIGHSETLNGISSELKPVAPAIYRKPAKG